VLANVVGGCDRGRYHSLLGKGETDGVEALYEGGTRIGGGVADEADAVALLLQDVQCFCSSCDWFHAYM